MGSRSNSFVTVLGALHLVFLLSGFSALGYQLLWTRLFAIGVGHEIISVLSVVCAFFTGLAAGSWCLDKYIGHNTAPWRWMVALEGIIGAWGLISTALIPLVNQWIVSLAGIHTGGVHQWACFLFPLVALFPATFAMGGTLPIMERTVAPLSRHKKVVGGLYAANTFGACLGTYAVVFGLAPLLGFRISLWILSAVNFVCALGIWVIWSRMRGSTVEEAVPRYQSSEGIRLRFTLFFTGLLGIGYEVLCVRALSQILENTVYTYANILAIYLMGTAAGAWAYQRWMSRRSFTRPEDLLLAGVLASCLLGAALLELTEKVYELLGEFAAAGLLFFTPSFFMGALFSCLLQQARDRGHGLGQCLAFNTLGAALAPFLFGVMLLPITGIQPALLLVSGAYGLLIAFPRGWKAAVVAAVLPLGLVVLLSRFSRPVGSESPETELLHYREGVLASVAVERKTNGVRSLKVNNRYQMGSTVNTAAERRQAHLPLLLHPNPQKALFLGVGTGITLGAAAEYPGLKVDGVELLPGVLDALPLFAPENGWPYPETFQVVVGDARRFVKSVNKQYHVIVADLFHPARDGAGTLYTVEHFRAVRARLTADGLFCQWLPLYQLDLPVLKVILKTFLEVFPHTRAYLGHFNVQTPGLALIGTVNATQYGSHWFDRRVKDPSLRSVLEKEALFDEYNLFSGYFATAEDLRKFSSDGRLNTDDHPIVMYMAPRFLAREEVPYARLRSLMDHWHPGANTLIRLEYFGGDFALQLELVWQARNIYLRGAMFEQEGRWQEALDHYLKSAAMTPHFLASYAVCLEWVLQNRETRPRIAKKLAEALTKARPEFEDAHIVLQELF